MFTTIAIICSLLFGFLSALLTVLNIVAVSRKNRTERDERIRKETLQQSEMANIKNELDSAHNKIRDLYVKDTFKTDLVTRIEGTLEENTRILRRIEDLFVTTARVEERLNNHIREEELYRVQNKS
jgi:5-bromo-4-chloroindolyl phosphate hydrolysis protein